MPLEDVCCICRAAAKRLVVLDEAFIHFSRTKGGITLLNEYIKLREPTFYRNFLPC
ncbi:MAG TPA: hypothetical protein EYM96_07645 [Rhodospirillales bacterium]|nr:hypothetical protein [Rhodospirillales bacterium]